MSLLAVTGIAHDRELLLSAFLARLADLPELTCADVEP